MKNQHNTAQNPSFAKKSTFIINPKASQSEACDALYMLLAQAEAQAVLLVCANDDGKEFNVSYKIVIDAIWAIQTQIETARATLDHMVNLQQAEVNHA